MRKVPITDKHRQELSPKRDFPGRTPVRMRYAILSSPRCGSTLLARLLYETRMAGDPLEYFNMVITLERERSGNPQLSLRQFLEAMEARRTSPNGMFGCLVPSSRARAHRSSCAAPAS